MKLKIAISGTRGIPNNYGGFEQFAQHLSEQLVQKGHEVTVYNSHLNPYQQDEWRGVSIIRCRDREDKLGAMGQFFYDRNCIRDARKRGFDVLLHLGYTSSSIWHRGWPQQSINIVNMDGLEWSRPKYGALTKHFLKKAEGWAVRYADHLVADSPGIRDYLLKTYGKTATYIPYGAEVFQENDPDVLTGFGLLPFQYYLAIARIEPDNNIETIIRGWRDAGTFFPLLIIGNTSNKHGKYLTRRYNYENLHFPGSIYDTAVLNNLRYYSKKYFHGHAAGGTNPSLLEAMACHCDIAAHDNIFNRAVTLDQADYFSTAQQVTEIVRSPREKAVVHQRKELNIQRIISEYNWPKITGDYEQLMANLVNRR